MHLAARVSQHEDFSASPAFCLSRKKKKHITEEQNETPRVIFHIYFSFFPVVRIFHCCTMSMIVTVCRDNEEHILSVDPGDDLMQTLSTMFGNISHYNFTIDGKAVSSMKNLARELHHNAKIEISLKRTRGASVSVGPRSLFCELKSGKNPARPVIKIETVHISCSSDPYDPNEDMTGMIVYSFNDQQQFELNGHRCRTGYVLIKASKNIAHVQSNQGIVHGSLFKWFFGIEPDNRFVGAGFAIQKEKIKFNSGVFNARNDDYHDDCKTMTEHEIFLVKNAHEQLFVTGKWQRNPTILVKDLFQDPYYPGDCLPIQNHPTSTMN